MSGKRLLDAIQLFNVAKSVAGKHLALRQRQLDVYTRTSSLTKGIQSQTEGLILTAKAAAALVDRFNEPTPVPKSTPAETRDQASAGRTQETDLHVKQAEAGRETVSDGTVPQEQSQVESRSLSSEEVKKVQRQTEIPGKVTGHPVEGQGDGKAATNAPVEEYELSDEMMGDIFRSPKVARILSKKGALDLNNSSRGAREPARVVEKTVTSGEQHHIKDAQTDKKSMEELGASLAQDTATSDSVCISKIPEQ
jgi:aarF domain-containing kinase